ncbi:MAG: TRAP transporter TatT component family protein [Thermoanaerobaculia bacterium]
MFQTKNQMITLAILLIPLFGGGCSLRALAANQIGNTLAAGGSSFTSDDDPELVGDALPFSLKLMERVLADAPEHGPLLVATCRGFTQYAYGWVDPDSLGDDSEAARERTKRLALRAREYGLRALSLSIDEFRRRLASDPRAAVALARKRDVPALYWLAAAWGLAISNGKDDVDLLGDLPIVEALISRAAELDSGFGDGAIDTFLITWEAARSAVSKEAALRSREHFRRAVELSDGQLASPFVAAAEALAVPDQNRAEFSELLERALAIDPDARPEWRLQNILARRRAAWLLAHRDDFFIDDSTGDDQ